jgi:hypothetical protein
MAVGSGAVSGWREGTCIVVSDPDPSITCKLTPENWMVGCLSMPDAS